MSAKTTLDRPSPHATLVDLLELRRTARPGKPACTFLGEDGNVRTELTFAELFDAALAVAARLQGLGCEGEPVLLVYPPGPEFLIAFLGCVYAGSIAIPLPLPRPRATHESFTQIVESTRCRFGLTSQTTIGRLRRQHEAAETETPLTWIASEGTPAEMASAWVRPEPVADALAYLQYTSGSTSDRKGVMITHRNVLSNLEAIDERFRHNAQSVNVSWLPHFHDLGLVAGLLQPIFHGIHNVLMSPAGFIQRPIRWLRAISDYGGTHSCSPNFGYDLCNRRITPEQCAGLNLSSWQVALNGAEPVRHETLARFTKQFGPYGLRPTVMLPAYGLAEATLVVSASENGNEPVTFAVSKSALEQGLVRAAGDGEESRTLVGCGRSLGNTEIVITDSETGIPCADSSIGEICIRGPAVASGYWQNKVDSAKAFDSAGTAGGSDICPDGDSTADRPLGDGAGPRPALRSGDLGFLREGELFITGRLKDLIVIRGANHYPQDIEWTVENSDSALRKGCCAAFSIDDGVEERLVVAQEVERDRLRDLDAAAIFESIRRDISSNHDLELFDAVLLKTGTIARTSSGKIQRRMARSKYLDDTLYPIASARSETTPTQIEAPARGRTTRQDDEPETSTVAADQAASMIDWLREYGATRLNSRLIDERRQIPAHVILDFGNHGLLGLQVPRTLGGAGLSNCETMQVLQQLGAIDQTLSMLVVVHNVLGIRPIQRSADSSVVERLVPSLAAGRELAAFAITEPAAGSNPKAMLSTATPVGESTWRLNGEKVWSGSAGWASVINVFVQNLNGRGEAQGTSGFMVSPTGPGVTVGPEALTFGMRGMVQNSIQLQDATVNGVDGLGEPGAGMAVAQDAMMHGRLSIGATSVGGIKRCLQLMHRYARRREISTGALMDNPVFVERMTTLCAAAYCVEALVTQIAGMLDDGETVPVEAYLACKTAGPEWLFIAADSLMQFLGGRGYIETNVAPQMLRDARVTRILEGPTEALNMFFGSRTANANRDLRNYLESALGAPEVWASLEAATAKILDACRTADGRFPDTLSATRWAYASIGKVATCAVLLAAARRRASSLTEPSHIVWANAAFDAAVDEALSSADPHRVRLSAEQVDAWVRAHQDAIGVVDQNAPDEDRQTDPLLRPSSQRTRRPRATVEPPAPKSSQDDGIETSRSASDIEKLIVNWMAHELKIPLGTINPRGSVFDHGLDSVTAVLLSASLEDALQCTLMPEIAYDFPGIQQLAAHIAESVSSR